MILLLLAICPVMDSKYGGHSNTAFAIMLQGYKKKRNLGIFKEIYSNCKHERFWAPGNLNGIETSPFAFTQTGIMSAVQNYFRASPTRLETIQFRIVTMLIRSCVKGLD